MGGQPRSVHGVDIMKQLTIKERLYKLEQKINLLMNNHLTHMDSRIRRNEYLLYTILFFLLGISWKLMWN